MPDAVIRRNVDARLVSYALALLGDSTTPEVQMALAGCAAAALQAASGLVALVVACKAAASSPVIAHALNQQQRQRVQTLLEGLGTSAELAWNREVKELLEVIVVLAAESAPTFDDEVRIRQWAQGVFLDTRALAIFDERVEADVEPEQDPVPKRSRKRKPRGSREAYQHERLENLVSRAVSMGVSKMRAVLRDRQIVVVGTTPKGENQLIKIRGSMDEATALCDRANEEIRKLAVGDNYP